MNTQLLTGKKIAVLVETEFIPEEISAYKAQFSALGATVHLMSRLWQNPSVQFVSDVDVIGKSLQYLDVSIDFQDINFDEYAAVIMAANYTSVRLRYFQPPDKCVIRPEQAKTAPAVQFMAQAMANSKIVKGFLCHGLWLLTPMPELLKERRIICHEVVLADIINAGAIYLPSPTNIVIDGDLVTGRSGRDVEAFINAIAYQIMIHDHGLPLSSYKEIMQRTVVEKIGSTLNHPFKADSLSKEGTLMTRKILIVISEWGYWGEELVGPLETFDVAGYQVEFATPTGRRPSCVPVSMDSAYLDPPLRRPVTSLEMAEKVRELNDPQTIQGKRLLSPINLSEWFPERPYWSAPDFVREMESYNQRLNQVEQTLEKYNALLIVGGNGPIVDLVNNQRVHDLTLAFYKVGKPIATECYATACLAFARNLENRQSIIRGKRVTGHCIEYDYKAGYGFTSPETGVTLEFGPVPYPLEYILRDATGSEGEFIGNFGKATSVVVDYPFITGRSTSDGYLIGQKMVEVLDNGLTRFGWGSGDLHQVEELSQLMTTATKI